MSRITPQPSSEGAQRLYRLVSAYLDGQLGTERFCSEIETSYNDAIDLGSLSTPEQEAFEFLFDQVTWYSPQPEEEWEYPGYRTGEQIKAAALKTVELLG